VILLHHRHHYIRLLISLNIMVNVCILHYFFLGENSLHHYKNYKSVISHFSMFSFVLIVLQQDHQHGPCLDEKVMKSHMIVLLKYSAFSS